MDHNHHMDDFDDEDRQLVLDFESTVLQGGTQFFDVDELEVIIDYYFEVNDLEPLQRAVEYGEQLYPNSTSIRLRRAHLLIAQQQFKPALDIILRLRRQEPRNTDVAYSLGVAYSALGESRKAIDLFFEAAADGLMLGRVYGNIAEEYYNLGDFDEAIRYYQLALDTDTHDVATLYNYTDTCIQAGKAEEAVAYLRSMVGESPYYAEAWHGLGNLHAALGQLDEAADAIEYAIAIDKANTAFYKSLASVQKMQNRPSEAVATLRRALDHASDKGHLYREMAYTYEQAGNSEMAVLYFHKAIEENHEDAEAWAALALEYAYLGDTGTALGHIKRALRLQPDDPNVLCMAGSAYDAAGNEDAATDCFERMIASEECTESQCRLFLHFLHRHKLYNSVIDFALESMTYYPNDPFYSTFLAAASFYTNRYNRASRALPYAIPELLFELCPDIFAHPRLAALIPEPGANTDPNPTQKPQP